jgi:pimeloyl-ACP methyl ester carboxylesterase
MTCICNLLQLSTREKVVGSLLVPSCVSHRVDRPRSRVFRIEIMLLPIPLLVNLLVGFLSLALLAIAAAAIYRAWRQYRRVMNILLAERRAVARDRTSTVSQKDRPAPGFPGPAGVLSDVSVWVPLAIGVSLLLFTFLGRNLVHLAFPTGNDEPKDLQSGTLRYIERPDGTTIKAEVLGRPNAPTLVFTHGWGVSSMEWYYVKRDLADHFRLIFWDLPGLGKSTQPSNRDYALEKMATDLNAVLTLAQGKPVVLVGHSIGGMINLTFCRLFPDKLGHDVGGIVQLDTSYTNPVTTTKDASLSRTLQKPVAEPLLHAMIWVSPLVRIMNWLSYQNGTSHITNAHNGFAGSETWGQLDFISRYGYKSTPSVVARGTLAMFHWDAKSVLPLIDVPVLLIVGQQDTTTLPSASEYMKHAMPNASLDVVSPSAHYGLLEQNKRYDSALEQFARVALKETRSK